MRVLTVGNLYPPAAQGGYERIWVAAVAALRAAGHEVRVLTSDAPAPPDGGATRPTPTPPDDVLRELRWYSRDGRWQRTGVLRARAIERHDVARLRAQLGWADVVSWWGMGGLPLALLAEPARAGVPAVGVVADGWMGYGFDVDPRASRRKLDLGAAARWLFISRAVEEHALGLGYELPRRAIVHPGVDAQRFPPAPAPPEWGWRLAYVGRVEQGKGVDVAAQALAELPEAQLTVDGSVDPSLQAKLELHDRVRLVCSDPGHVAAAYAAADAILFPVTWPEPWGLVPLEAMSVGRPVIATGTGGSGEYLRDGENCLLVAPGDASALAEAVRRLAGDPALRSRLRQGGFATAARYSAAAFEAAVVEALEEATGTAGRRAVPRNRVL